VIVRARHTVRAIVGLGALLLIGAAAGWLPFRPVLAIAASMALVIAGEAWIKLSERLVARAPAPFGGRREGLVDTSALIDGRIQDVVDSGFLDLDLIVPEFVLRELQHVADSPEPLRRARGRRGLDVVHAMRGSSRLPLAVVDDDVPAERAVDLKLVALARRRGAALITTDFTLNKVAGIHDVVVLNVNELAHALRPVVLPGERLRVAIVKDGKEPGQGVAYLEDGTMIVVEQGRGLAGRAIDVVVTSAIQTAAGKMFFARLADS
jgi:uncharacterized protein YacL